MSKPAIHQGKDHTPKNPDYGSGTFRRWIRLTREDGVVRAELEDCNHGFVLELGFDEQRVTSVDATPLRYPMNTCPGAIKPLQQFVGYPVDVPMATLRQEIPAKQNCTHLYDLAVLAVMHLQHDAPVRVIDVAIEDEADESGEPASVQVRIDGELVLDWQCLNWQVTAPESVAGQSLFAGYTAWAHENFSGAELDAVLALQKGYLVAQARRFDLPATYGYAMDGLAPASGVCYSYQPEVMAEAVVMVDYARDFTHNEDALGRFDAPLA